MRRRVPLRPSTSMEAHWCRALRRGKLDHAAAMQATEPVYTPRSLRGVLDSDRLAEITWSSWVAATHSPKQVSLTWLETHRPDLIPQPINTPEALRLALEGREVPWGTADWLVAHTRLAQEAAHPYQSSAWARAAVKRNDTRGIRWLLQPPAPMPAFQNDRHEPLLLTIVYRLGCQDKRPVTHHIVWEQLQEAMAHGVPDVPAEPHQASSGDTALSWTARLYQGERQDRAKVGQQLTPEEEGGYLRLWVALLEHGSDRHHTNAKGQSPLDLIAGSPLAHTYLPALRQPQGLACAPSRSRVPRRRT